jgi:hypothetical protein
MSFTHKKTNRGFELVTFTDRNGKPCTLQQSSAIVTEYDDAFDRPGTSAIWLGTGEERMHLNREQVHELAALLNVWLHTGSFTTTPTPEAV